MSDNAILEAIELALANAKRVERESRVVVRDLARLRDAVQSDGHDGDDPTAGGTRTDDRDGNSS